MFGSPYIEDYEERPAPPEPGRAARGPDEARAAQEARVRAQLEGEFDDEQRPADPPNDAPVVETVDEDYDEDEEENEMDDDPDIEQFHSADQGDSPRPSVEYVSPAPTRFSRDTFAEARRQSQTFRSQARLDGSMPGPGGLRPPVDRSKIRRTGTTTQGAGTGQSNVATIGGEALPLRQQPVLAHGHAKVWDKTKRSKLKPDVLQTFIKSATGYALSKHNKLTVQSLRPDDEGKLEEIHNLHVQLRTLRDHLYTHDMLNVFTIVLPVDVRYTHELRTGEFDLFTHYAKFNADIVANSNAWYNQWVQASYISENMTYSLQFLQSNTSESLWNKCLESYEDYPPAQRGGPLMLFLILKKIQDNSESAIEALKTRVTKLKIRDIQGENVDTAVSLIKSTYTTLESASTAERNYIPDDFPQTVLKVMQTSSVKEFNEAFATVESRARHAADMDGVPPIWPEVHRTLNLATNTYGRLQAEDNWNASNKQKKNAYNATPGGDGPPSRSNHGHQPRRRGRKRDRDGNIKCWNCNKHGHTVPTCPEPRNEEAIEANRSKYQPRRGRRQPRDDKGRPLKFNKNQVYVVDCQKWREEENKSSASNSNSRSNRSSSGQTVPKQDREEVKSMLGDIKQALTAIPESARDGLSDQMDAITEKVKNW